MRELRAVRGMQPRTSRARLGGSPGSGSKKLPLDHLQRVAEPAVDPQRGGRLEARVHHAVLAPGVVPVTVLLPGRLVQEVVERSRGGCR